MKSFLTKNLVVITLMIGLFNMILLGVAFHAAKSCNVVYTIGVNRLTESFTKQLNNTTLSKDQQSAQMINFAKGLESSLREFKVGKGVLLMEEAVLSGGQDITEQVVKRIKSGMDNLG